MLQREDYGLVLIGAAVALLAVASMYAVPAASASDTAESPAAAAVQPSDSDEMIIRIRIDREGTAHWQVDYYVDLGTSASEDSFERVEREFTNPPGRFMSRMESAVEVVEDRTGRRMRLLNGSVETVRVGDEAKVVYRFQWTNFSARPAEDRLVVGDAIVRNRLERNESLVIEWSDGLREVSITPPPHESQPQAIFWFGPELFRTTDPRVELERTGSGFPRFPLLPATVVVLLALAAGMGWYLASGQQGSETDEGNEPVRVQPTDEGEELLSDEERVLRLLKAHDGRMKQQDLLAAVEWSRTKTSDVVNEMNEAEQIEVYRLGRENVLALPGEIEVEV